MSRPLLLLGLLGAAACGDTQQISTRIGDLDVSPELTDVGVAPLGIDTTFEIELSATVADLQISAVRIENLSGSAAEGFFRAPPPGETVDGVTPIVDADFTDCEFDGEQLLVRRDTVCGITLIYNPGEEGYHRANVVLSSNAENLQNQQGEIRVEVRGRGDIAEVQVVPWVLDLGAVEVGETRNDVIEIYNNSELELAVTRPSISTAAGQQQIVFPAFVDPEAVEILAPAQGAQPSIYELELSFTPVSDDAFRDVVGVFIADQQVQVVQVVANDCENGNPIEYDRDQDGYTTCGGDCDDENPAINPGQPEVADGVDNDCNDKPDDTLGGYDDDGDGYCDADVCVDGSLPGDCNDGDPRVNPGEVEVLGDGIDNDCDGVTDDGTEDFDGDGYTVAGGDCDDTPITGVTFHPGHPELEDGLDNDCDLLADEETRLYDDDGDAYCEGVPGMGGCTVGSSTGDCDDTVPDGAITSPGAPEIPDHIDNNCDGVVDEGTIFSDDDMDGYTEEGGDCDDDDAGIGPHVLEIPGDGTDQDCIDDPTD